MILLSNYLENNNFIEYIILNKKRIYLSLKEMFFFSGGNFIAQIIMMVYTVVIARELGPSQLGIYSGIYAIAGITVTIVNWGMDTWMLKEAHHFESIQVLTGNVLTVKVLFGLVWGLLLIVLLPILRPNFFIPTLVVIVVLDVFFDVSFNTIIAAWNIQRKIKRITFMLVISKLSKFTLLIILITLNKLSPLTISLSRLSISLLVLLICFLILKPIFNKGILNYLIPIIKNSAEFSYSEILAVIYGNVDVAILTFLSISTNVGLYSPASGIIHALFVIPNSIYNLFLPKFAKKFSFIAVDKKNRDILKILTLFFLIGLMMFIGVALFGKFIIVKLLGNPYLETGHIITILSPILFIKSLEFGMAVVIVTLGFQRKRLVPQFIVALVNIIGNLLLIPLWGITAVAWVYVVSEFILMIGYSLIVLRSINKKIII